MIRLIDFFVYVPIPIMLLIAWRLDICRCGMLMGRSFFAFLLSMWLFGPLAQISGRLFSLPLPYLNATCFVLIWGVVFLLFPVVVKKLVKLQPPRRRLVQSGPCKVISGFISGWFAMNALMAFLVMLPEVEGLYLANNANPLFKRDRRSSYLYAYCTLTTPDILLAPQIEAGAEWIFQVVEREEYEKLPEIEHLPQNFILRYRTPWPKVSSEKRKQELKEKIEELLSKQVNDGL